MPHPNIEATGHVLRTAGCLEEIVEVIRTVSVEQFVGDSLNVDIAKDFINEHFANYPGTELSFDTSLAIRDDVDADFPGAEADATAAKGMGTFDGVVIMPEVITDDVTGVTSEGERPDVYISLIAREIGDGGRPFHLWLPMQHIVEVQFFGIKVEGFN